MIFRVILFFSFFVITSNLAYSQLGRISASVETLEIDTIGNYSDITLFKNNSFIGVTGSFYDYPNWAAYSSNFGDSWKVLDAMDTNETDIKGTIYSRDFKEISFNNDNEVIVFSDKNKFFIYTFSPHLRYEYLLRSEKSLQEGNRHDFILQKKIGDDYYIYTRSENSVSYKDKSAFTILNSNTLERRTIELDMFKFAQMTDARGEDKYKKPYYNDEYLTNDKCFFTTISHFIDVGEEYPVNARSLVKIEDLENPIWKVLPMRFTDSTSIKYIFFDDCQNGYLSTYKTHNKEYPRLYKTSDGGESWVKIYEDNETKYVFKDFKRANDSTLFSLSGLSNIYRTTDNGYSWYRVESGLKGRVTDYEIINENIILVANSQNSIAKITLGSIISNIEDSGNSNSNNSVYPNPATNTVNIDLDYDQYIRANELDITVYDVIGNEINTNGEIRIEKNKVVWDCANKPSGVYLIRINDEINKIIKE